MKVTLCPKNLGDRDIPQHKFSSKSKALDFIDDWIEERDLNKSVLVCFQDWNCSEHKDYRNQQTSLLISHDWDDIMSFTHNLISYLGLTDIANIDYAIFEFETYQDAISYCKDLKESF